jgi:hypothetical protein
MRGLFWTGWSWPLMARLETQKAARGITPCGSMPDCWFPSSIAPVISGGERKVPDCLEGHLAWAGDRRVAELLGPTLNLLFSAMTQTLGRFEP